MLSHNISGLFMPARLEVCLRSSTGWRRPGKPSVSGVSNPIDLWGFASKDAEGLVLLTN